MEDKKINITLNERQLSIVEHLIKDQIEVNKRAVVILLNNNKPTSKNSIALTNDHTKQLKQLLKQIQGAK